MDMAHSGSVSDASSRSILSVIESSGDVERYIET